MVKFCVCGGCTNSRLSGHRVHTFPTNRKSATFRAFYPSEETGLYCGISNEEHGYLWSALYTGGLYSRGHDGVWNAISPPQPGETESGCSSLSAHSSIVGSTISSTADPASARTQLILTKTGSVQSFGRCCKWRCTACSPWRFGPRGLSNGSSPSVLHCITQCNIRPLHRSSGFSW